MYPACAWLRERIGRGLCRHLQWSFGEEKKWLGFLLTWLLLLENLY